MKEEIDEGQRIEEELRKITRTGRQPKPKKESKEKKKKREDRVSGKSFEGSNGSKSNASDSSSMLKQDNVMFIPEDDHPAQFGGKMSPQTSGHGSDLEESGYHKGSKLPGQELSVIMSELESENELGCSRGSKTLETGKETSNSRRKKKKEQKEIKAKRSIEKNGQGGTCGNGACCTIF